MNYNLNRLNSSFQNFYLSNARLLSMNKLIYFHSENECSICLIKYSENEFLRYTPCKY